jgi:voltage-gated potassium channel
VERGHVGAETEHTGVHLAHEEPSPVRQVWRRLLFAMLLLAVTVAVIYADRDGYRDGDTVGLSLLDSVYYATVTLSTTGYGDITPITPGARLVNILLITPLRITFLLVLIGTTLEALTARSREEFRIRRWRSRVRQHVIVCGYGTKGRSAIRSLQALGTPLDKIVVVDPEPRAVDEANSLGLTGIVGDAGRTEVLRRASVERARAVIVAANRDDAAVLITLTVRQLNPTVPITTSVREEENANLLRSPAPTRSSPPRPPQAGCSGSRPMRPGWSTSSRTSSPVARAWTCTSARSPAARSAWTPGRCATSSCRSPAAAAP